MGPAFVRRRMVAELGPDWAGRFKSFEPQPAASASLGQVHRAVAHDGRALACKLQYPDMQSAVEADLNAAQGGVRAARAHEPGHRYRRDPEGGVGAAARGARLRAGSAAHGALRRDLRGRAAHPRAGSRARAVDQAAADHDLARGPAAARLQGGAAGGSQRHRARHVPGLVVSVLALRRHPRRSAPRQLHDLRGRGQRDGGAAGAWPAGRHQPARLRLHPHLPDAVRAGRDRSLHRPAARASAISSCTPTRPGASPASPPS